MSRAQIDDLIDEVNRQAFEIVDLRAKLAEVERERDEARATASRVNRRAQEHEASAMKFAKIQARINELGTRKPLPRIEAAFALAAARADLAAAQADNARLRSLIERMCVLCDWAKDTDCYTLVQAVLSAPSTSLAAHDDEVIERCAKSARDRVAESSFDEIYSWGDVDEAADAVADAIRALKGGQ